MAHKVIRQFKEKHHNGHLYNIGDEYPAKGQKSTKSRIDELSTQENKYKQIFIEGIKAPPKDKE